MWRSDPHAAVSESLQADVMRFMAIIAFCLIAILALVRGVEPPAQPALEPPEHAAAPEPQRIEESAGAAVPQRIEQTAEVPVKPAAVLTDAAMPAAEPARPSPPPAAAPQPAPAPASQKAAESGVPAPPEPSPADRGLVLRFASEGDFLRLVNRGELRVFAFTDRQLLALTRDFRFEAAESPGAVHELLPQTIPARVVGALGPGREAAAYRWGIRMPARMSRQIRRYLEQGVSGELVINRFGEVHHHAGA